jgi:hypothetical protein
MKRIAAGAEEAIEETEVLRITEAEEAIEAVETIEITEDQEEEGKFNNRWFKFILKNHIISLMAQRYCPNCQVRLGSYDHFFCTNCGVEIPKDDVQPGQSIIRVITVEEKEVKKLDIKEHFFPAISKAIHILNLREIVIILILSLVIGIPVYYWLSNFSSYIIKPAPTRDVPVPPQAKSLVVDLDEDFKEHIFGSNTVWEYIPYEVSIYVEGHDFEAAGKLYGTFDEGYKEVFEFLTPYVDSHFAAYYKEYSGEGVWTIVVFPYDNLIDDNEFFSETLSNFDWLKTKRVDDALVISTLDVFHEVEESRTKVTKNLSLNPEFAKYKADIPKSGKILFITFDQKARNYLFALDKSTMPETMDDIIGKYLQSEFDNVVFK